MHVFSSLSLGWRTKLETIIFSKLDRLIENTYVILNMFIFSKMVFQVTVCVI